MVIFDSTNPADIPADAPAVAGYVDGLFGPAHPAGAEGWDAASWDRFSGVKIRIAAFATTDDGHALDVERGDATPSEAPGWVIRRRAAGIVAPWVYVNRSNRAAVEAALAAAGLTADQVALWVATLDGTQTVAAGPYPVAAVQYASSSLSGAHYDLSITTAAGDSSGVITGGDDMFTDTDRAVLYIVHAALTGSDPAVNPVPMQDVLANTAGGVASLGKAVAALQAAIAALTPSGLTTQQITDACIAALRSVDFKAA